MKKLLSLFTVFVFCFTAASFAQVKDSLVKKNAADTSFVKKLPLKFEPRKATIRSAIAPGWGQIYNKKYWKLPLVWGALGTTAGIYFYNVKYYRLLKQSYIYKLNQQDSLVDPEFRNLSAESIRSYRNSFRQNVDYSVIFFLLFWGLNVVDATVDAHLKAFDVSDDLSLEIKPGYSPMANTSGISLVLNIGKQHNGK
jgi:hypothetical protein